MSVTDLASIVRSAALDTFGENPSVNPIYLETPSGRRRIPGIFEEHREVYKITSEGHEISGTEPALFVDLNLIGEVLSRGAVLIIRGVNYRVRDTDADGEGGSVLLLERI